MPRSKKKTDDGAMTADFHATPEGPVMTAEPPRTAEGPNDVAQAFAEKGITAEAPAKTNDKPKFSLLNQFHTYVAPNNRIHVGKNDKARMRSGSVGAFIVYFDNNPNEGRAQDDPHPVIQFMKDSGYRYENAPDNQLAWMKPYDQGHGYSMRQQMDANDIARKAAVMLGATVEQGMER